MRWRAFFIDVHEVSFLQVIMTTEQVSVVCGH